MAGLCRAGCSGTWEPLHLRGAASTHLACAGWLDGEPSRPPRRHADGARWHAGTACDRTFGCATPHSTDHPRRRAPGASSWCTRSYLTNCTPPPPQAPPPPPPPASAAAPPSRPVGEVPSRPVGEVPSRPKGVPRWRPDSTEIPDQPVGEIPSRWRPAACTAVG